MSRALFVISILLIWGCVDNQSYPKPILAKNIQMQYNAAKYEFYRFNGSICDCMGLFMNAIGKTDTLLLLETSVQFVSLETMSDTIEYTFTSSKNGKVVKSIVDQHLVPCASWLKIAYRQGCLEPIYVETGSGTRFFYTADDRESIEKGNKIFFDCIQKNSNTNEWLKKYVVGTR